MLLDRVEKEEPTEVWRLQKWFLEEIKIAIRAWAELGVIGLKEGRVEWVMDMGGNKMHFYVNEEEEIGPFEEEEEEEDEECDEVALEESEEEESECAETDESTEVRMSSSEKGGPAWAGAPVGLPANHHQPMRPVYPCIRWRCKTVHDL